jgi:hypothetical protein
VLKSLLKTLLRLKKSMSEILVLISMWIQALRFKLSVCLRRLQKSQPPMRAEAVGSNAESTQLPYMSVIVGKISQEAKLSRVRALSNATKLAVKLDG